MGLDAPSRAFLFTLLALAAAVIARRAMRVLRDRERPVGLVRLTAVVVLIAAIVLVLGATVTVVSAGWWAAVGVAALLGAGALHRAARHRRPAAVNG